MANFQVSLTNPATGAVDITDSNDVLTIKDHSNYESTEAGHTQSDFADFRLMKLVLPNGTVYWFSSLDSIEFEALVGVSFDSALAAPAGETLPMSTSYAYSTGDGQYWIYLYALPTYSSGAAYEVATNPYVYYSGDVWKALQDSTGQTPSEGVYWTQVTDVDDLPSKYRLAKRIVLYSDQKEVWARRVYNAVVRNNSVGVTAEQLLRDEEWLDAMKMYMNISAIPVLMKVDAWTEVDIITNFGKDMMNKYEA